MKKPSPYLTFAGAIPFIACALLLVIGTSDIPILGATADVLSAYGLVIASFMAGSQWGNHLSLADDDKWAVRLPLVSNVIAIALWLGFLMLPVVGFIWLLVIGFASMWMIDYGLNRARIITQDYFKVRTYVTAIVIMSLIVAAMQ